MACSSTTTASRLDLRHQIARSTSCSPMPDTPEITWTGPPMAFSSAFLRVVMVVLLQRVAFVQREDAGLVAQDVGIGLQLVHDGAVILGDGAEEVPSTRCSSTLQRSTWARNCIAKAAPFGGAFDQAGNIGHDEFGAVDADHAKVRHQRGEGIIGDLRPRVRHGGQKGRFARHWAGPPARHRRSASAAARSCARPPPARDWRARASGWSRI